LTEVSSAELTAWAALYEAETAERAEADAKAQRQAAG
jgi:hypothetical protein